MSLAGIRQKFRLFPFRSCMGKIARECPAEILPHLLVRWFSCPFELLERYVPRKGKVCDLGCGHGLMLHWLASFLAPETTLLGFDIDRKKIDFARAFGGDQRVQFEVKDITAGLDLHGAAGLILNDVLHMLSFSNQELLLRRCFGSLAPGGTLIIKEINAQVPWKLRWAGIQAYFVRDIFHLTRGEGFYPQTSRAFTGMLETIGFKVEAFPVHRGYAYPHMLYLCRKD
jgi:SAM-dependent methyltransferase